MFNRRYENLLESNEFQKFSSVDNDSKALLTPTIPDPSIKGGSDDYNKPDRHVLSEFEQVQENQVVLIPQPSTSVSTEFKYGKLYFIYGIVAIIAGPVSIIFGFLLFHLANIFLTSIIIEVFVIIGGIFSIVAYKKMKRSFLVVAVVFNMISIVILTIVMFVLIANIRYIRYHGNMALSLIHATMITAFLVTETACTSFMFVDICRRKDNSKQIYYLSNIKSVHPKNNN